MKMDKYNNSIIYNMDCIDYMKSLKDKSFDLAIVDPPYGINQSGNTNKTRGNLAISKDYKPYIGNDKKPPNKDYFNELFRVSKHQIIWGANHFITNINKNSSSWLVWDKKNGLTDFADCELAYTSFNTAVRIFKYKWQGMLQENMKNKEIRIHPNQKPVALYDWILDKYATNSMRILDTHLGSGSIRISAFKKNISFVGIELDNYYYKKSIERFNDFLGIENENSIQKKIDLFKNEY